MLGGLLWCLALIMVAGMAIVLARQLVPPRSVYPRIEWDEVI